MLQRLKMRSKLWRPAFLAHLGQNLELHLSTLRKKAAPVADVARSRPFSCIPTEKLKQFFTLKDRRLILFDFSPFPLFSSLCAHS
jgi:hypothetical protein